jgi:protein-disulfide isomerase
LSFRNQGVQIVALKTLAVPIVLILGFWFVNATETSEKEARLTAQLLAPSLESANYNGNETAKVTIIEFGDYQCTFCKRFMHTRRIFS